MLRRYWGWVRERQHSYSAGFRPPLDVLLSLFTLTALVTGSTGLLVGLAGGAAAQGLTTGVAVALPVALALSVVAKHQAHRAEADPWRP
jgi:hypothetical protein